MQDADSMPIKTISRPAGILRAREPSRAGMAGHFLAVRQPLGWSRSTARPDERKLRCLLPDLRLWMISASADAADAFVAAERLVPEH
jgi:hypothetical protein